MPRSNKGKVRAKKGSITKIKYKKCILTEQEVQFIDYKEIEQLKRFVSSSTGKILPRRITNVSAKYQRKIASAVKQAREMALLPFIGQR